MDINTYALSRQLGHALNSAGMKLVTAESCTAGELSAEVTRVPGSSAWFDRSFVTYSNQSKVDLLDVKAKSLKKYGAVSEQVALEMALGALKKSGADLAISITGIAGPMGGSIEKPVGLVWFGLAQAHRQYQCRRKFFDGGREHVRRSAMAYALSWLLETMAGLDS